MACLDGSELGSSVVPHAELVARALGARLTLLRVLEVEAAGDGAPTDPIDWRIRRQEARAHLDDVAAQLPELESGIRSELLEGRAAEQICCFAEHHDVDLTVLCSHGSRGVTEWGLASTARKLIERVPGSLLLVPAAAATAADDVGYRRILVPLDGSARAESVIPLAMRIALAEDAEVLFVHVVPVPELTRIGPLDAEGEELERRVVERNHRVASAYLDRLRARVGSSGTRVRTLVVRDGSARTRLERIVREEGADLVVMSAHGHSGRTESPCGSVTESVVTRATCPLLVVRERPRTRESRVGPSSVLPRDRSGPPGNATL